MIVISEDLKFLLWLDYVKLFLCMFFDKICLTCLSEIAIFLLWLNYVSVILQP